MAPPRTSAQVESSLHASAVACSGRPVASSSTVTASGAQLPPGQPVACGAGVPPSEAASPSWPYVSSPQQATVPSPRSAHAWWLPTQSAWVHSPAVQPGPASGRAASLCEAASSGMLASVSEVASSGTPASSRSGAKQNDTPVPGAMRHTPSPGHSAPEVQVLTQRSPTQVSEAGHVVPPLPQPRSAGREHAPSPVVSRRQSAPGGQSRFSTHSARHRSSRQTRGLAHSPLRVQLAPIAAPLSHAASRLASTTPTEEARLRTSRR